MTTRTQFTLSQGQYGVSMEDTDENEFRKDQAASESVDEWEE